MESQNSQPFSWSWVIASLVIFTGMEIAIAVLLAPAIFAGRLASPMLQMRLQMLMHLGSFLVGGVLVGLISPRVRMTEPAVGAFISVALVFLMSVFMPTRFMQWDWTKVFVGGGIAFGLAMFGAYSAEKWMGNIDDGESKRAQLRNKLWGESGLMSRGDTRYLSSSSSDRSSTF